MDEQRAAEIQVTQGTWPVRRGRTSEGATFAKMQRPERKLLIKVIAVLPTKSTMHGVANGKPKGPCDGNFSQIADLGWLFHNHVSYFLLN